MDRQRSGMILLDPAVGSRELLKPLQSLGLDVQLASIDADIAFEGRGIGGKAVTIGVEFKKIGELVQSLRTGRLQGHQLLKMQKGCDFRWLLCEGPIIANKQGYLARKIGRGPNALSRIGGHMTITEFYKRLLVLQVCGGLTPTFTQTRQQSLKWIEALYRTWTDVDLDQHKSHIAIYEPPHLVSPTQFARTIFTLPGIGHDKVARAESKFKSLRTAFNAGEGDWASLDGIGRKTAQKILEAITREGS